MATPKKRTGKASQNSRRANWKGSVPATTTCPNCKAIIPTHTVCPECGYYKNGFASIKKQKEAVVEEPKKETKKAKTTAEAEVKEEATEAVVEEPKKTRKPRAKKAKSEETEKAEKKTEEKTEETTEA